MAMPTSGKQDDVLSAQVRILRRDCPELYDYLVERDRTLQKALRRIPSPDDIERSAVFNMRTHLAQMRSDFSTGIADLDTGKEEEESSDLERLWLVDVSVAS